MARALDDIIRELDTVYRPQRDLYNQQLTGVDPALDAEKKGLMAQKEDSFRQITDQANRRGMFYSGMPIAEEQRYTGQQFLPAVANLQSKYATQKFGLQETLAKLISEQHGKAYGIREGELARDEEQRQFNERLAAEERQAAANRAAASSGGGGASYGAGYGGGGAPASAPAAPAPQLSLRQQWQREANQGDWNAQVALNYAGDDGRYNGHVNSQAEYNILKQMGIAGNYYVARPKVGGGGGGGW